MSSVVDGVGGGIVDVDVEAILDEFDDASAGARGWELEPKAERGGNGLDVDLEVDEED